MAAVEMGDWVLVTGSTGFLGKSVIEALLRFGFRNIRCLARFPRKADLLRRSLGDGNASNLDVLIGNLLSPDCCREAMQKVSLVLHLAAGIEKSFPSAFLNSAVATRNLVEAALREKRLKRFVNISSIAVYSNWKMKRDALLDETCDLETDPCCRNEPYVFGKINQDHILGDYISRRELPGVILRPGVIYGPGMNYIPGRVGINTFGVFLHLGGDNKIPFTYLDNCGEAIVQAGIRHGIEGEVFNIVDDELPSSREFLKMYKRKVQNFRFMSVPYPVFYTFCHWWEWYSAKTCGELPAVFNRKRCAAYWKGNTYSNSKAKNTLGWTPRISIAEGMRSYLASCPRREDW